MGGLESAEAFGVLDELTTNLRSDDQAAIAESVKGVGPATEQVSWAQGFFTETLRHAETSPTTLRSSETVSET